MLPRGEVPHALLVLGAIGVAVEMPHAGPLRVLEQLHEEERALHVLAAEAEILVEASRLLGVQVDVKELAGFQRLRDAVREVEPGHRVVRDLGIETDHVRVCERVDERQHVADRREEDVAARLVRLGLERELAARSLCDCDVLAEKVDARRETT